MRSRLLFLTTFLAILGAALPAQAGDFGGSGNSLAATTATGELKVYNVSLKLVACTNDPQTTCSTAWKTYFQRLTDKDYRPDIINILEVPFAKKDAVLNQLATVTGTPLSSWGEVHSDKDTPCADPNSGQNLQHCGNNMVVWHYSKFAKLDQLRFVRTEETATMACHYGGRPYSRDVAVQLQEKDATGTPLPSRVVVTAAVHVPSDLNAECLPVAVSKIETNLAYFTTRPLTVLTGDFNEGPFRSGGTVGGRRREVCLDDWYRSLSVAGVPTTGNCSPDPGTDFKGSYLDAIRWKHYGDADAICQEWSHSNLAAHPEPGACDSGKGRIDFIWIRKESAPGTPITDSSVLGASVLSAETDRGYYRDFTWSTRYSDHRALEALLAF
jgi:hypothetical protein